MLPVYSIADILKRPGHRNQYAIDIFDNFSTSDTDRSHRHDFYEIFWVRSGAGVQAIDFEEYTLAPGQIYFLSPGEIHHWAVLENVGGIALFFTEEFYTSLAGGKNLLYQNRFFSNPENRVIFLQDKDVEFLNSLFEFLDREQKRPEGGSASYIHAGIDMYLALLDRNYGNETAESINSHQGVLLKLKGIIQASLPAPPSLRVAADELGLSSGALKQVLKDSDNTLKQMVIDAQIMESKRRLLYTGESIHEISVAVGFNDQSYFARLFKKRTELTPLDFRARSSSRPAPSKKS